MSYSIFLDDERFPSWVTWVELPLVEWTIVRNYDDFVKIINKSGIPDIIAFDHDLGGEGYSHTENINGELVVNYDQYEVKTGLDCAKFLVEYCIEKNLALPRYVIHSMNVAGCKNIQSYLQSYEKSLLL